MDLNLISWFFGTYVAVTYTISGFAHISDRVHLRAALAEQNVLGVVMMSIVATLLGPVEIGLATIVVLSLQQRLAFAHHLIYLVVLMGATMSAYIFVLVRRQHVGTCGCASGTERLGLHTLWRSISLALSSVIVAVVPVANQDTIWSLVGGIGTGACFAFIVMFAHIAWSWVRLLDSQLEVEHALDY